MEPLLSITVFAVAVVVAVGWALGQRWREPDAPGAEPAGERSAIDFVEAVQAELGARGLKAEPVGGTFAIQIGGGRQLPLLGGFQRFARERDDDAATELVAAWERAGLLEDRESFRARVVERLVRDGFPAERGPRGFSVRVGEALLVLDEAYASEQPVSATVDGIASDVAWWRSEAPARSEIDDDLEIQVLPAVHVAREDLAARLRARAAGVDWSGPQPVAHLGAGWVARVTWIRRGLVKPVASWAAAWNTTPEALLQEVAARAPAEGHPFRTWQPGVLQAALGDARDLRVLLMDDETLEEMGLGSHPVVWPLQSDRVVVAEGDDEAAVARLLERAFDGAAVREPLSWVPLVRGEDGGWRWLAMPPDHELSVVLERLVGEQLKLEYGWIWPVLLDLAEAGEIPPPVPLTLDDGGRPVAVWTGASALVPAEVHTVVVDGLPVPREQWAQQTGARLRDDLGLPWLEVGASG